MKITSVGLAIAMACTGIVSAPLSAHEGAFEATLGIGEYRPISGREIEDSNYHFLGLGYYLTDEWMLELYGAQHDTHATSGNASIDANSMGLRGLYAFQDQHAVIVPYALLGLANAKFKVGHADRDSETGVQLGLGIKIRFTDWMHLRLEASNTRYESTNVNDGQWFAGLSFTFGGAHRAVTAATAAPIVSIVPRAVEAPVAEPTPTMASKDSDGDGVSDDMDKCPATPAGMSVNAQGCAQLSEKVSIRLNVKFDTSKADVKAEFANEIDRVAKFMRDYPSTKVVIEGHTDSVGNPEANKALSQKRADAVANSLVRDFGIAADRVSAIGYGKDKPVADNANAEGRAQNRRVTAEIEEQVKTEK